MKKLGMFLVGTVCIGLLSGCGDSGKKLKCTYDLSDDNSNRMEYILNFDKTGEKISSYTQSAIATYENTTDEEFDSEYEDASKVCDNYKDMKGVKCDVSKNKKEIRVDLKVNLSELDDAGKESLATAQIEDYSYTDFKEFMESASYTCE